MSSSQSSITPAEPDVILGSAAEIASLKRQLAVSQNKLAEVTNGRPKKTACVLTLLWRYLCPFYFLRSVKNMGRGIRKIVSLFENLTSILDEADQRIVEEEDVSTAEGAELTEDAEDIKRAYVNLPLHLYIVSYVTRRDRTFTSYKLLLRLVPQLKSVIQDPELDVLNTFLSNVIRLSHPAFNYFTFHVG
jgi:hypothetical protein